MVWIRLILSVHTWRTHRERERETDNCSRHRKSDGRTETSVSNELCGTPRRGNAHVKWKLLATLLSVLWRPGHLIFPDLYNPREKSEKSPGDNGNNTRTP